MCLSKVYENEATAENLLAADVAAIDVEGGTVTLTDLFGRRTTVTGSVRRADLTGGTVILQVKEQVQEKFRPLTN